MQQFVFPNNKTFMDQANVDTAPTSESLIESFIVTSSIVKES